MVKNALFWSYYMEMGLLVEMVPQKKQCMTIEVGGRGKQLLENLHLIQCPPCWLLWGREKFMLASGKSVCGPCYFRGNFVAFLIPWPGSLESNKILFFSLVIQMEENVNSCPSGNGAFSSTFLHIILLEIYFFSKLKPLKRTNQISPLSLALYCNYHQLLTFWNSFPKMKLWWVCTVIIIFTLVSTI